ncbi:MAG TPA: helix-turn-helix domain-containing protein [Mycobacterium sp.]
MAGLSTPSSSIRAIFARLDADEVARQMDLAFRELPGYARFVTDDPTTRGHPAIRWNVALVLRWLSEGIAPDESMIAELHEVVRERALAAEPMRDGLVVYRRGIRIMWNMLVEAATDEERPMLLDQADILWSYLELVVDTFSQAYDDERDTPGSVGERRARTLLDRMSAQQPLTVDDRERAEYLGFDLAGPHRPFVARLDAATTAEHVALAGRLRSQGVLATTEGNRITGLCAEDFDWTTALEDSRFLLARERATERSSLAGALETLRMLVGFAASTGRTGLVTVRDFLLHLLLAQSPQIADDIVARVFGGLDGNENADLVATLRCLAANSFDRGATAAELFIHRNTVLYRVQRVHKLTGLELQNPLDQTLVCLAILWTQIKPEVSSGPNG